MKNGLVDFKGTADGVRIKLDAFAEAYEIIEALENKIRENKPFFGDGNCGIRFEGRNFTPGEKQRFESVTKHLLPSAKVSFVKNEKKSPETNEWLMEYKEKHGVHPEQTFINREPVKEDGIPDKKEFYSMFRSSRARFYEGIVRSGMHIHSDGHLILLGTGEPGSDLKAAGNIIVIGGLYGSAHAGCNGHNGSYILAMDMRPEYLKIADVTEEYTYDDEVGPEEIISDPERDRKRFFGRLKKKNEQPPEESNDAEKEISAVALLKNNKIQLDNFTIKTFTNPENMI